MHRIQLLTAVAVIAAGVLIVSAVAPNATLAQTGASAFTYQGRLDDGGAGVDAPAARIQFSLWDAETEGSQIGSAWVSYPVEITAGLFTTLVDFGAAAYEGENRWLEINIDVNGGTSYTLLEPRQRLSATPMAVYALRGGDNPWTITGSTISYTSGNVGVGTSSPPTLLTVGKDADNNIVPMAHLRTTGTNSTASLRFENGVGNHYNLGITGAGDLALGYNANVPLSGDLLRITPSGDVGIGRLSPASKLDVNGTVRMTGFQLGESATDGYVLTTDASGIGTWQPAPTGGGDGYWSGGTGGAIYYNGGNVGIGNSSPTQKLTLGEAADNSSYVRFNSSNYAGLLFYNSGGSVAGRVVYEHPDNVMRFYTGQNERVRISSTGDMGIGTNSPASKLDVNGTAKMNGFQLGTSTTAGHVLTADVNGVGTWQPADGLTLPYSGTTSDDGFAFEVVTSAEEGRGVVGRASHPTGNAWGVFGISNSTDGVGVLGWATADTGTVKGGYFQSQSTSGTGVFASTPATSGITYAGHFQCASPDGFAGYFSGAKSYFSGNVGIGKISPSSKLDVDGTVRMTGFRLDSSATAGYVLTADASGIGTWQPAPGGGETYWSGGAGGTIYYNDGNVGIGTTSPTHPLEVLNTTGAGAIKAQVDADGARAVEGVATASGQFATATGVYGETNSNIGYGVHGHNPTGAGVKGTSDTDTGIVAQATAESGSTYGIWSRVESPDGYAGAFLGGRSYFERNVGIGELDPDAKLDVRTDTQQGQETQTAIRAISTRGHGVSIEQDASYAQNVAALYISSNGTEEPLGIDVNVSGDYGKLARFQLTGTSSLYNVPAFSVKAETGGRVAEFIGQTAGSTNPALYAEHAAHASGGVAAYFRGNATVTGTLSKGGGSFKIDHPLDPANKYLYHSFVESPDMMNIYNGNIVTDGRGYADVELPEWFEALNRDFRYQLTVIDETDSDLFVQAKVVRTVENGSFAIRTSAPNVEVSWQVTGIRQDAFANAHRIPVEEDKPLDERGTYLHPEAHGLADEMRVDRGQEENR